jgi:hypothetical protein
MKSIPFLCSALLLAQLAVRIPARAQFGPLPGGPEAPLASLGGTVRSVDAKLLTIEDAGGNVIQFHCSRKTRYFEGSSRIKASAIQPGDHVSVEARRDVDGRMEAVIVRRERQKTAAGDGDHRLLRGVPAA